MNVKNAQVTEAMLVSALRDGPLNEIELARAAGYDTMSTGQARTMLRKVLRRIAVVEGKLMPRLWVWRLKDWS